MLTHTVTADTDGTMLDNRIPEETCGMIPIMVLGKIGDTFVADDFRYLCIGVHTCQTIFVFGERFEKRLMGEFACQF